jgi:hypothetical protein
VLRRTRDSESLGTLSARISELIREKEHWKQLNQKYEREIKELRSERSSLLKSLHSLNILKGLSPVFNSLLDSRNLIHKEVKENFEDLVNQCIENIKSLYS